MLTRRTLACSALVFFATALDTLAAPALTSFPPPSATVSPASDDPNLPLWNADSDIVPQAMRGTLGGNILGPQNVPMSLQNPDLLAPPTTDHGTVQNAHWPFALSHNRLQTGGWARQQNGMVFYASEVSCGVLKSGIQVNDMPIAKSTVFFS